MPSTGKAKRSKGGKKNELLAKPKRPMSAYNFFFRVERAKILSESNETNSKTSFEDMGRLIGQRWRSIDADELARYKQLAKEDNARYREQMKTFYNDELNMMCHRYDDEGKSNKSSNGGGANGQSLKSEEQLPTALSMMASSSGNFDQKYATPGALFNDGMQVMNNLGQQPTMLMNHAAASGQGQINSGQGQLQLASQLPGAAMDTQNPFHNTSNLQNMPGGGAPLASTATGGGMAGAPSSLEQTPLGSMNDDQVLQLLLQHQQSSSMLPNERRSTNQTVVSLILNQKATMQNHQHKLAEELKGVQVKLALLDQMLANEMSAFSGQNNGQGAGLSTLSGQNAQGAGMPISAPSPMGVPQTTPSSMGVQHNGGGSSAEQQLLQTLQRQAENSATTTATSSFGSLDNIQQLGRSNIPGGPLAASAPPQDLQQYGNAQAQQQPSTALSQMMMYNASSLSRSAPAAPVALNSSQAPSQPWAGNAENLFNATTYQQVGNQQGSSATSAGEMAMGQFANPGE